MWAPLASSDALGWVADIELRPHTPQGEAWQLRYPSRISATTHVNRARPFHISALPTNLDVVSSVNPWL